MSRRTGNKRAHSDPALPADGDHPSLSRKDYDARLPELQRLMRSITLSYVQQGLAGILMIEGSDAAGKGGAIRRLTAELDPRHYDVWPIGPPTPDELRHHYLWRFWQRLPARGEIGIFDRSWYGRVLVERVESLTPERRWRQAYDEIRSFEQSLVDDGIRLVKIYLHVSAEEQRARLRERIDTPHKHWKISAADFRNHLQRAAYSEAATEMFAETATTQAPWHVIAADDKHHARLAVLETATRGFARDVDLTPLPLDEKTKRLAADVLDDGSNDGT